MKYLKKFATTADYESAESGLALPNVSLVTENNAVHYNPSSPTPPTPTHDYIEIGGIKWATMNVGASSITDAGLYFAWGDTQGYTSAQVGVDKQFTEEDYKYGPVDWEAGTNYGITKYNNDDHLTVLQPSDDAVTAAWGGNWRMPTKEEYTTLLSATTSAWTSSYEGSGVKGVVLTSTADSSKKLFFPAAGYCDDGDLLAENVETYCMTSSINNGKLYDFYAFYSDIDESFEYGENFRYSGCPVRGILDD